MFVLLVLIGKSLLLEYFFELEYSASAINRLRVAMMLLQDTSVTDHNILGKNTRDTTVVTVFSSRQCAKINIYNKAIRCGFLTISLHAHSTEIYLLAI